MQIFDMVFDGISPKTYRPGQMIYLQGTEADRFYYLQSGSVRSFISLPNGEERVIKIHRAGDLMGEASFFDSCPRVTSAAAISDCTVCSVTRTRLNELFAIHPELAMPMLQYLARTVRILSHHVNDAALPAAQRIARCLLAHMSDPDGTVSMTHEELGQAVGVSRVTVSRTLCLLAEQNILKTGYGAITVLDPSLLRQKASD